MEQVTFGKGRSTVAFGAIDRGAPDDPYSDGYFALEVRGDGVSASARVQSWRTSASSRLKAVSGLACTFMGWALQVAGRARRRLTEPWL